MIRIMLINNSNNISYRIIYKFQQQQKYDNIYMYNNMYYIIYIEYF